MNSPEKSNNDGAVSGVGLGLRWAFLDQVVDGEVPASIRFFEISPENYMRRGGYIPDALATVVERHPVMTHGLMLNIGGTSPPGQDYLDELREFLRKLRVQEHSDHLCWTGHGGQCLHDLFPLPLDRAAAIHVADQVRRVQDHLQVPLALENISYYGSPGLPRVAPEDLPKREAAFVCEVLQRAGCRLLLDVNNVHVNGQNHGFDPLVFLRELPLEHVQSLHVAGGEARPQLDGLVIDTHGSDCLPAVRELMAWVIERTGALPVVYERDHNIPSLAVLGEQVAELQVAYDEALTRHDARAGQPQRFSTGTGIGTLPETVVDLGQANHGLSRVVLDANTDTFDVDFFCSQGIEAGTGEALAGLGARLGVYRDLSRATVISTVANFLPRTLARLPAGRFEQDVAQWLAGPGPCSRYLRDLPLAFAEWVAPRWTGAADVADYVVDLARHELIEFTVATAVSRHQAPSEAFELTSVLHFATSCQLADYAYAVHRLPEAVDDRSVPSCEPTCLLVYRDPTNRVRYLQLSALARVVTQRLMAGERVQDALTAGARDVSVSLDNETLGRMSVLLADFAQRGVVDRVGTSGE
ncbi:MAG: DUF692 family multinuclear iron-containing protein [Nannocystaceae bacterium]